MHESFLSGVDAGAHNKLINFVTEKCLVVGLL